MKILSFDPAIKNFGYSLVEIPDSGKEWKLENAGTLRNPVQVLEKESIDLFCMEIKTLFDICRPDRVVVERFLNRGMMQQAMNEKVGVMIGIILSSCTGKYLAYNLVTPSAWKNTANSFI